MSLGGFVPIIVSPATESHIFAAGWLVRWLLNCPLVFSLSFFYLCADSQKDKEKEEKLQDNKESATATTTDKHQMRSGVGKRKKTTIAHTPH